MKTLHTSSLAERHQRNQTVRADVVFGSSSKRCVGIGICQVNPYDSNPSKLGISCCQRVDTQISRSGSDQLRFQFSRSNICKKMITRQFAFSRFRIVDLLVLPEWLTVQLQIEPAELVPGTYAVTFSETSIAVLIRIAGV